MKAVMFNTKQYDIEFFNKFNKNIEFKFIKEKLTPEMSDEDINKHIKGMDAIIVFVNDNLDKRIIDLIHANGIKCICTRSAGYNHIDVCRANKLGIKVLRVPAYSPNAVAEQAIALLMSVVRKTHRAYIKSKINDFTLDGLLGFDIFEKDVAVYGCGRIGKIFVKIMQGFGANVTVYDAFLDEKWAKESNVKIAKSEEDLFANADIISLHAPLFKENKHIINDDMIAKMRKGVIIINASRGALIDTKALIRGLRSGRIEGAGLDVYENETDFSFEDRSSGNIKDPQFMELIQLNNVVFTPHSAFFTIEALTQIASVTLNNLHAFNDGVESGNEVYVCG